MRTVVVAAVALATLTSAAFAEPAKPIVMTAVQMDQVTAGGRAGLVAAGIEYGYGPVNVSAVRYYTPSLGGFQVGAYAIAAGTGGLDGSVIDVYAIAGGTGAADGLVVDVRHR